MAHADEQYDALDSVDRDGAEITCAVPKGKKKIVKDKRGIESEKIILKLRACISCRIIMTEQQFYDEGCPNCSFLQMDGDRHRVLDCTNSNFKGFISLIDAKRSWVARFNKLTGLVPGCYAVKVFGEVPDSVKDHMQYKERIN